MMIALPAAPPVTSPELDTLATVGLLDLQVTVRPTTTFPVESRGVAVMYAVACGAATVTRTLASKCDIVPTSFHRTLKWCRQWGSRLPLSTGWRGRWRFNR